MYLLDANFDMLTSSRIIQELQSYFLAI